MPKPKAVRWYGDIVDRMAARPVDKSYENICKRVDALPVDRSYDDICKRVEGKADATMEDKNGK